MGTFVKSASNPTAPLAANPYVEQDSAIVRGATIAMLDLSNSASYALTGPVLGGAVINNLVSGGLSANVVPNNPAASFPAIVNGTLTTAGITSGGGYPYINLPVTFNFGSTVTRSLIIDWVKLPSSGFPNGGILGLCGSGTGTGTSLQWVLYIQSDASGNPTNLVYRVRTNSAQVDCTLTGAALAAFLDGNLHQIGLAFQIVSGQAQTFMYVDGVLKVTSSPVAGTGYNTPGGTPTWFTGPGVSPLSGAYSVSLAARQGRISAHDLTARIDLTFAAMLASDAQGAAGFVS